MRKKDEQYIPQFNNGIIDEETERKFEENSKANEKQVALEYNRLGLRAGNAIYGDSSYYPDERKFREATRRMAHIGLFEIFLIPKWLLSYWLFYKYSLHPLVSALPDSIILMILVFLIQPVGVINVLIAAIAIDLYAIKAAILMVRNNKIQDKFRSCNSTEVEMKDGNWECPCCKLMNTGRDCCERCGVLPVLK